MRSSRHRPTRRRVPARRVRWLVARLWLAVASAGQRRATHSRAIYHADPMPRAGPSARLERVMLSSHGVTIAVEAEPDVVAAARAWLGRAVEPDATDSEPTIAARVLRSGRAEW